ncbi:ABC transporter ATP-binding protein [Mesorhizobium sp. M0174]|uniref:ABC transporter ATP-binding protein n=1 Tax=Mesorhizobium sp. M0174 TaxID=2956904 RepID=UPI003338F42E
MQVEIQNLRVAFPSPRGVTRAVKGVSFKLGAEKVAIVGESGSGKSITARSILKLLPKNAIMEANKLSFDGIDIITANEAVMRSIRGRRAGLIMQDPKYSLNPVINVGKQIAEAWRQHRGGGKREAFSEAIRLLEQVNIRDPKRVAGSYAHELSGGMGQRVMIAMMLAPDPELLIADEPTSALDGMVQSEILRLIDGLLEQRSMGLLLISHDLPLVSRFCDRVLVMYAGRIVEECRAKDLHKAEHPYTQGLLKCLPSLVSPVGRLQTLRRDEAWAMQ